MGAAFGGMFVVSGIVLGLAGCRHPVPRQTALMKYVGGTMSSAEMRVHVYEFGRRAGAVIEAVADSIVRRTNDPVVKRNALLLKINALPAFEEAALQTDPLGAAAESYALASQLRRYLAGPNGRAAFGLDQSLVVRAASSLERDAFAVLTAGFPGDSLPTRTAQRFAAWLEAHPLASLAFERPSLAAEWPQIATGTAGSFAQTVGSVERATEEISDRLAFANEHLMKQFRWNMTLMASDAVAVFKLDSIAATSQLALRQMSDLMAETPTLVRGERDTVLRALRGERDTVLRALRGERDTVLTALRGEREAVLAALQSERIAVLAAVREERIATMASLDGMMEDAFDRSSRLIDHAFWRLAQLLAACWLATLLMGLLGVWYWRRERRRGRT